MPAERFYLAQPLTCGTTLSLGDEEYNHLVRVMRKEVGDTVEVINGQNCLATAQITAIDKKNAQLTISLVEERTPLQPTLILAIAIPRFSHLEWTIEKATELGASAFYLFPGDKSEKKSISDQQMVRLHNLMVAALKQCGRLDLPLLEILPPLSKWHYPPEKPPKGLVFFGDTDQKAPLLSQHIHAQAETITFFTGPEAGFSTEEELLLKNVWQAQGVSLHPYTLRAETAPILATGLIRHLYP